MNTIKKIIFAVLLCVSCNAAAQNLNSMPAAERNALLISIAKDVVLIFGPDYYREYGEPIIERNIVQRGEENLEGINAGRVIYRVTFLYDRTQERFEMDYAAMVNIWGDTGRPASVLFGNGWAFGIPEHSPWNVGPAEPMPFQQVMPFPIYDWDNPDRNQVPRNIDELTRRGLVRDENGHWVRTRPDEPPAEAQRVIRRAQEELRQRQAQREREGSGGRR